MSDNKNDTSRRDFLAAGIGVAAMATIGFMRTAQAETVASPPTFVVTFRIRKGKEAEAVAMVKKLTAAVEKNEPGALAYLAHRDTADPMKLTFIEMYKDQDAVKAHRNDPAMQAALPKFSEIFEKGAPEVKNLKRVAGFTRAS